VVAAPAAEIVAVNGKRFWPLCWTNPVADAASEETWPVNWRLASADCAKNWPLDPSVPCAPAPVGALTGSLPKTVKRPLESMLI
jgi:hypothetical protein